MNAIKKLHQEAMHYIDNAQLAKLKNDNSNVMDYLNKAFMKEREAALKLKDKFNLEPTRSILLRSAASLALQCKEIRESEKLISISLAGDPPSGIADELRNLLEQVYFERHLETKGITLDNDELRLSLSGEAVGYGVIQSKFFLDRIGHISTLFFRTAERLSKFSIEKTGKAVDELKSKFGTYLYGFQPGSFAVILKLGKPLEQIEVMEEIQKNKVIDEFIECLNLYGENNLKTLSNKIDNEGYFNNFIALSERLLPDGEYIKTVGFVAKINEVEKKVQLKRTKKMITLPEDLINIYENGNIFKYVKIGDPIQLMGTLLFANKKGNKREIQLVDKTNNVYKVKVPEGIMDDIVRPYFDKKVIVRGIRISKTIVELQEIDES